MQGPGPGLFHPVYNAPRIENLVKHSTTSNKYPLSRLVFYLAMILYGMYTMKLMLAYITLEAHFA